MLVSCLCITEDRPAFMDWLLWNYEWQTWPDRELVIVDSSRMIPNVVGDGVRVIPVAPGTDVATKRNVAMDAARGEVICWFDDDDWQHPDKCGALAEALAADEGAAWAGCGSGWFLNLGTLRAARYEGTLPLLPVSGFRRRMVDWVRFADDGANAVDTAWLRRLQQIYDGRMVWLGREDLSFWLCGDWNAHNPASRWMFDRGLDDLQAVVGEAWGDTDAALADLRARVGYGGVEDG